MISASQGDRSCSVQELLDALEPFARAAKLETPDAGPPEEEFTVAPLATSSALVTRGALERARQALFNWFGTTTVEMVPKAEAEELAQCVLQLLHPAIDKDPLESIRRDEARANAALDAFNAVTRAERLAA